uniref:Transmembrane protein n=1 Tax=Haemonchus contortus TaxID=6289 RepID=A0A7I4YES5_HAECO
MTVVAAEYRLPRTGTLALRPLSSKADSMLVHIWLTMSFTIAITQLLVTSQPEWIVSRDQILGLFALCNPWGCEFREINALMPLVLHLMGSLLFLLSAFALVPAIFCSSTAKPMQRIAHLQITAAIAMGLCSFIVPLNMHDIGCTVPQILRSSACRVGWAYAASSVCSLVSICCPVLGKLASDDRRRYALLVQRPEHFL